MGLDTPIDKLPDGQITPSSSSLAHLRDALPSDAARVREHLAACVSSRIQRPGDELKNGPEKLELKPMVREYVECLSTIHYEFRELTKSAVDQQLRTIAEAKARFFAAFPDAGDIGLAVYLTDDDGIKIGEETPILGTMGKYL